MGKFTRGLVKRHLQYNFMMVSQNPGSLKMALKCLHAKTYLSADKFDLQIKFIPLDISVGCIDHLKDREFSCENAVLDIYDSEVSGRCGSMFTAHRTEIKFHIFSEERSHQCAECDKDIGDCVPREFRETQSLWKVMSNSVQETTHSMDNSGQSCSVELHENSLIETGELSNHVPCGKSDDEESYSEAEDDTTTTEIVKSTDNCIAHPENPIDDENKQPSRHETLEDIFKCDICGEQLRDQSKLQDHVANHVSEKHFSCSHCDKTFSEKINLSDHMQEHSGKKSFECSECGRLFNRSKALKRHKLNHHSNIPVFICRVCKKGFTDDDNLRYHVYSDHKGNEKIELPNQQYKCSVCPKTFNKSSLLKNHLRLHRNGKPYRCLYCGITFKDEVSFELHHEIHKGESGKPFTCKNCGQCFSSLTFLKEHKGSHDGEIYKCSVCDKIFQSGKSLRDHMNIHNGIRSYVCNICGKALVSANRLKSHLKTHIIDKPYKCDYCDKSFINPGDLTNHRRVHTGEKPYLCEICGKGFAYKTSVPKHMVIHSDTKPFKCDVCNKDFASYLQMYNHKKIHLGLKNFICEICGKRFTTGKALKVHKLMHEGYSGHNCEICGKKYRNVYYLEIHRRTHTGKNLLQCHMCGDSFADPTYFKLHQKKFCKTILIYCELCNRGFPNNKDLKSHMGFHSGERPYGCDICGKAFAKSVFLTDHMKRHNPETLIRCSVCGKGFINKKEVRRHEARHKNINKKRASPRIPVSMDRNIESQNENMTMECCLLKSFDPNIESSSQVNTENHDKVLQDYVESIESIKKSVITSPSGYAVGRSDVSVNTESTLPSGPSADITDGLPQELPTNQPLIMPEHDTVYYGHINSTQSVTDPMANTMTNSIDQNCSSVFTRERGEILLMQEGLAAIMNQADRRSQTYVPPMQYYYPQQQNRY